VVWLKTGAEMNFECRMKNVEVRDSIEFLKR
jgi:hypothetical protein